MMLKETITELCMVHARCRLSPPLLFPRNDDQRAQPVFRTNENAVGPSIFISDTRMGFRPEIHEQVQKCQGFYSNYYCDATGEVQVRRVKFALKP
jgi:hypothetical protein